MRKIYVELVSFTFLVGYEKVETHPSSSVLCLIQDLATQKMQQKVTSQIHPNPTQMHNSESQIHPSISGQVGQYISAFSPFNARG